MSERLRSRDLAFLTSETPTTPNQNASLETFDPTGSRFDYDHLVSLIADRLAFVPRYRQKVRTVPGRIAPPVWVDDEQFDLHYHVRRSALPRPGSMEQLRELTARIIARPLDQSRPLWEVYFVEGLADGRVALLSKSHQALVDGAEIVDLAQVLLDRSPEVRELGVDDWYPGRHESATGLVLDAIRDSVRSPFGAVDAALAQSASTLRAAGAVGGRVLSVGQSLASRGAPPRSPIEGTLSQQRRFVTLATDLADYRTVRDAHGGSVNDVVLATIAGALRTWLMARGESLGGLRQVRALVPVSVLDADLEVTSLGSQIAAHLVDLPVGEPSPVVRLHQVSYSFLAHKETRRAVSADRIAQVAGFAPSTFHAMGSRVGAQHARRGFQLMVTNVPGPQTPLYAAGALMEQTFPVPPLLPGHALAIGVTSYVGKVFYGLTADRDLLPDADRLGTCLAESLAELVDTAGTTRRAAPRSPGAVSVPHVTEGGQVGPGADRHAVIPLT